MKKQILWIAMCPPLPSAKNAGGHTYYYYYNAFVNSGKYDITSISKLTDGERQDARQCHDKSKRIYIENSYGMKRIWDIAYSAASKINPYSKYGNTLLKSVYRDIELILKNLHKQSYNPDYVILEWGEMGLFIENVRHYFPNAKYIISEHDVMFLGTERKVHYEQSFVKRLYAKATHKNIKARELKALNETDLVVVHNDKDRELLLRENINQDKLHTIVPYYSEIDDIIRKPNQRDIVFYGAMNRKENYLSAIWFIENVMPLLKNYNVKFIIIGGNPHQSLQKYISDNVIVTGFVKDLKPYFECCCCMVAPLVLGAGIKIKILEAVAAGVPVLTNKIGIEGIPLENNIEYIHCEKADEYANCISKIVSGKLNVEKMACLAKEKLKDNFNMEKSLENYIDRITNL